MYQGFKEYIPKSVTEVLEFVLPHSNNWHDGYSNWIFRGQRDSSWPLLPSLYRQDYWNRRFAEDSQPSWRSLLVDESKSLLDFIEIADQAGLSIPNDGVPLREGCKRALRILQSGKLPFARDSCHWSFNGAILALALMQHSGIATSLLDWTLDPKIALYFACINRSEGAQENAAIWCLNRNLVERLYPVEAKKSTSFAIKIFQLPTFDNAFLRAQSGLFTMQSYHSPDINTVSSIKPLEVQLEKISKLCIKAFQASGEYKDGDLTASIIEDDFYEPLLMKVVIESSFIPELQNHLKKMNIYLPTLFPDFYYVAEYINKIKENR